MTCLFSAVKKVPFGQFKNTKDLLCDMKNNKTVSIFKHFLLKVTASHAQNCNGNIERNLKRVVKVALNKTTRHVKS